MDMIKLCGVGVLCALAAVIMKQIKSEYGSFVRVGGVLLLFGMLIVVSADIFSDISGIVPGDGLGDYAKIMMKALGISLISKICADICRDIGEGSVGGVIEIGGKLAILSLCAPLIGELVGYAGELLGMG